MNPDDFNQYVPGFADLDEQDRVAITDFALWWSLFEARLMNTSASAEGIKKLADNLGKDGKLANRWYLEHLEYFRARYVENGDFNYRFDRLNLRNGDDPVLVKSVLLKANEAEAAELSACLIVVLRYRNNFFHGLKWEYGFAEQRENFQHAIALLRSCIDLA